MIPLFISWSNEGKPLIIFGDGEQTRDFVYVQDVVQANIKTAESKKCDGMVLNVAGGEKITINELGKMIGDITGKEAELKYEPARPGDIVDSVADVTLVKETTGFEPAFSLRDGLERTVEWFLENTS